MGQKKREFAKENWVNVLYIKVANSMKKIRDKIREGLKIRSELFLKNKKKLIVSNKTYFMYCTSHNRAAATNQTGGTDLRGETNNNRLQIK